MNSIRELDLIFFNKKHIWSDFITKIEEYDIGPTELKVSHVGIVLSNKILKHIEYDGLMLFEAILSCDNCMDSMKIPDIGGRYLLGVQLRRLDKILEIDNKNCIIGTLINRPELTKDIIEQLNNYYNMYLYRPFQLNPFSCFGAIFSCCRKIDQETQITPNSVFCSELVSIIYKAINVLPNMIEPKQMTPLDLAYLSLSNEGKQYKLNDIVKLSIYDNSKS